jgi:alanine dehydrogenase
LDDNFAGHPAKFVVNACSPPNAALPYAGEIANKGWTMAMQESNEIMLGANAIDGKVTYQAVAEAFDSKTINSDRLL